ncbi:MAG: hypothetical protein U0W40_17620 [Acidimicrobiia bacterium]
MNADGSGKRNLTDTLDLDEDEASWSPDGTQIAYSSLHPRGSEPAVTIDVIGADGSGAHAIVTTGTPSNPTWSPDGTKIIFESTTADVLAHTYVVPPSGGDPVTTSPPVCPTRSTSSVPSPDGTKIIYASNPPGSAPTAPSTS